MTSELIHLLIIVIVIACLFWVVSHVPIPAPYAPISWVLYLIVVIIALAALLPFLGVHLGMVML